MKRIIDILIRIKELYKYRHLLKRGQYYASKNFKCLCRSDKKQFALYNLCAKVPFIFVWICSGKSKENYSIVLLSNTTKDDRTPESIKFFDFEKKLIRTQYNSINRIMKDQCSQLSRILLTPRIVEINTEEKYIIEEYIVAKRIDELTESERIKIVNTVIDNHTSYYPNYLKRSSHDFCLLQKSGLLCDRYCALSSGLKNIQNIEVLQHGDLTLSNLLYANNRLYYIDFEHEEYYFFLYDVFWLIQNDFVYNNNSCLMNFYLSGNLDHKMFKLFDSVGAVYIPENRKDYFILFLASMYNCRVNNLDSYNIGVATHSINYVLNFIDSFGK